MLNFLRSLEIDRTSFWLGFLAATLFWWIARIFWPRLSRGPRALRKRGVALLETLRSDIGERHRQDTFKHVQQLHIAAPLFSLDEIVIPPRVFTRRVPFDPESEPYTEDIVTEAIPYMPDRPEFASAFEAHTLSLDEALAGGMNLILVAPAGGGKTTALAWLTTAVLRGEINSLPADTTPFFVHAMDINLAAAEDRGLLDLIADAVALYSSALSVPRLPAFIRRTFERGSPLLVIDGCDELPPEVLNDTVEYIAALQQEYRRMRFVVAASPLYYDGFTRLNAAVLPLRIWGLAEQARYLGRWGELWREHIDPLLKDAYNPVEPLLLNNWILNRIAAITPLELTLQAWGVYAGDQPGPGLRPAIKAYLRRMSTSPDEALPALEGIARHLLLNRTSALLAEEAPNQLRLEQTLPELLRRGVLRQRVGNAVGLPHPEIFGYLAAASLAAEPAREIRELSFWSLQDAALRHLAAQKNLLDLALRNIRRAEDPLMRDTIAVSGWLRLIPLDANWRAELLKRFSRILNDEAYPLGARARIISDLAATPDPAMGALFRRLLDSPLSTTRQLAALSSGFRRQAQEIDKLASLLHDAPPVCYAAALALINIGTKAALEEVAAALVKGSEPTRRAAAEAFANHPEEGHPTLREATTLEDLLIRRAAIYGLRRIREVWAIELLEKVQIEDGQWVVKNAAAQAYEERNQPDPHIPRPLPSPADAPWLITFAAEQGESLGAGEAAWKLLLRALQSGDAELQLAALDTIGAWGYTAVFPAIYKPFLSDDPELQLAAYDAIWNLASAGVEIPPPLQFGLG